MSLLSQLNSSLSVVLADISKSDGEEMDVAIKRGKAVCEVAKQIVDTHRIVLDATKLQMMAGGIVTIDDDLLSIGHGGIDV